MIPAIFSSFFVLTHLSAFVPGLHSFSAFPSLKILNLMDFECKFRVPLICYKLLFSPLAVRVERPHQRLIKTIKNYSNPNVIFMETPYFFSYRKLKVFVETTA